MLTVLTPTCDRPEGLALAERWMARQTLQPDEWIVVDGGQQPARCRLGQLHLRQPTPPGAENFVWNLQRGLEAAQGDQIIIWEDDDWYGPSHLEQMALMLSRPGVTLAGDDEQRYYNVAYRRWKTYQNKGASLCQTGLTREALPWFREVLDLCLRTKVYGVDGRLWAPVLTGDRIGRLQRTRTVMGIKGLPGRQGLGVGHRSAIVEKWTADPQLETLRGWIGSDVDVYAAYGRDLVDA